MVASEPGMGATDVAKKRVGLCPEEFRFEWTYEVVRWKGSVSSYKLHVDTVTPHPSWFRSCCDRWKDRMMDESRGESQVRGGKVGARILAADSNLLKKEPVTLESFFIFKNSVQIKTRSYGRSRSSFFEQ